jgi:hypothetical protein
MLEEKKTDARVNQRAEIPKRGKGIQILYIATFLTKPKGQLRLHRRWKGAVMANRSPTSPTESPGGDATGASGPMPRTQEIPSV